MAARTRVAPSRVFARAIFFHRLGEIRDRSFENHRSRASDLNLVTAAIVLWNTVYLERAIAALSRHRQIDDTLIASARRFKT
jgi:TnpA family transposase